MYYVHLADNISVSFYVFHLSSLVHNWMSLDVVVSRLIVQRVEA